MKVYGIQFSPEWESKTKNFQRINKLLETASILSNSLIVLPETFSTGFSLDTQITAKGEPLLTLSFMSQLARKYQSWIMGGVIVQQNGKFYNRLIQVSPSGDFNGHYDKIHLIPDLGEDQSHAPGKDLSILQIGEFKICPIICYDLRFPELFRKGIQMGANLFVVIACWPKIRVHHWKILLQARAIENQSYVLGVNRTGEEPNNKYSGNSLIIGPKGEIISEMKEEEGIMDAKLQFSEISKWRNEFPVLRNLQ